MIVDVPSIRSSHTRPVMAELRADESTRCRTLSKRTIAGPVRSLLVILPRLVFVSPECEGIDRLSKKHRGDSLHQQRCPVPGEAFSIK